MGSEGSEMVGGSELGALRRAAFEASPDGTLVVTAHDTPHVLDSNAAFAELFGWRAEDARGLPLAALRLWRDPDEPGRRLAALRRTRRARWEAIELRHRDGTARVVDAWASIAELEGAPVAVLGLRERRIGDVVPAARAALERFIEVAPDAVVGVDTSGSITIVNRQAERLFRYDRSELLGRPVEALVPMRLRDLHQRFRDEYFEDPRTRPMGVGLALFGRRSDGSEFPAEISLSSVVTDRGRIALTAIRDISERVAAERAIREEERRREVLGALLGAEEAERSRIATALHDDTIQVMTASLVSLDRLALAAQRTGDNRIRGLVEDARQTIEQATERTRRLTFELRPTVLHERGIAAALRAMMEALERETGIRASLDVPDDRFDWSVEELVYRTVQEAIANVRKHSNAGRVAVTLRAIGGRVVGEVIDDGRGFDVERATDRAQMAFHVGLDAMGERVRMVGGTFHLRSKPGRGARVRFEIPTGERLGAPGGWL